MTGTIEPLKQMALLGAAVILAACPLFKSSEIKENELRSQRETLGTRIPVVCSRHPNLAPLLRARWERAKRAYARALTIRDASARVAAMQRALDPVGDPLFELWRIDELDDEVLQGASGKRPALVEQVRAARSALAAARPNDAELTPLIKQAAAAAWARRTALQAAPGKSRSAPDAGTRPRATPDPRPAAPDAAAPPADGALRRAAAAPIDTILAPRRNVRGRRALSVEAYVRAQVCDDSTCAVTIKAVPCKRNPAHVCVAVDGDPCASAPRDSECEGLWLTIVVDATTRPPRLDHARSGDRPVRTQQEVQRLADMAP